MHTNNNKSCDKITTKLNARKILHTHRDAVQKSINDFINIDVAMNLKTSPHFFETKPKNTTIQQK